MESTFSILVFFVLLCLLTSVTEAQLHHSNLINLGSILSPIIHPTSWLSPSGRFAFGFYQQSNGYAIGIWLVGNPEKTVVWTANRDDPPVSSNATLDFTKDGMLLLRTMQGQEKHIADVSNAASASMLDSGNLVLYNNDSKIIWQSFDFPTDSILGGQNLLAGHHLVSSVSETDHSTGQFRLLMQDDGNLVLYPLNTLNTSVDAYWSTDTYEYGPQVQLYLNQTGALLLRNNTGYIIKSLSNTEFPYNTTVIRATLDVDGIFRLYSHSFDGNGKSTPKIEWPALDNQCEVKSFCGFNSYCTFMDNTADCLCLKGFDFVDPNQRSSGCQRSFTREICRHGKGNAKNYIITTLDKMTWGDPAYFEAFMTEEDCRKSCLEDCNCEAALHEDGSCKKQKLPLRYVRRDQKLSTKAFLKVGNISIHKENPNGTSPIPMIPPPLVVIDSNKENVLIVVVTLGFVICSCVAISVSGYFIFKDRVYWYRRLSENGNLGLREELTLRMFSYNELVKATDGFKEELGRGSFGAVYKGALSRGKKPIAVKRLEKVVEEGEREFRAEMRAIGRTHHRNLVRLFGYCAEDSKRLLVYEYMSNGSLADSLFKAERRREWNERVRMALDVARGILYLHEECETPIIHCDIKPQNILIDDFWTAKISDFGLAKLLMPDQTRTFTGVRGTRGYLAPEWQKNTPISVKADIYSFGIVLLEIICCRRNLEVNLLRAEEIILSTWVYNCFVARQLDKLVGGGEVDKKTLETMVKVGLWCIQDEPALRPSMKSVILMLQGIMDVPVPPSPL